MAKTKRDMQGHVVYVIFWVAGSRLPRVGNCKTKLISEMFPTVGNFTFLCRGSHQRWNSITMDDTCQVPVQLV